VENLHEGAAVASYAVGAGQDGVLDISAEHAIGNGLALVGIVGDPRHVDDRAEGGAEDDTAIAKGGFDPETEQRYATVE
jgi:hypothetical protein